MYVLDTNAVSYFFRGEGRVAERLLATAPREIAVPAIVSYELRYGVGKLRGAKRISDQLEVLLDWVAILPFDDSVAQVAAEIRVKLERAGKSIGPLDILIAATSVAANGTLVTRNVFEFGRIPNLKIANWYD